AGIPITPCDLRSSAPAMGEAVFTAHHPGGAAKKFQRGNLASGDPQDVTGFDFAGGSSGSALFDANGKVIGAALAAGPLANACNAGYTRASSVTDTLAHPPVPGAPWDVMVVIDRSGSMSGPGGNGQTKLKEAQDAASLFVQLIRSGAGDTVGMDSFSTSATNPPDSAPAAVTAMSKQNLVGNAPYTGGVIGSIGAGGNTSIGDGLKVGRSAFPAPHGGSQRAILLLTDGLQNTWPMIADVESQLGGVKLFIVGYGDDANLDGPLLTKLARDHGGLYVRADHGLALRKFFGLSFGNIFQSGALVDPEYHIAAGDDAGATINCEVCDETMLTAIVGWDKPAGVLGIRIEAPDGTGIDATSPGIISDLGATWTFLRVPLPYAVNRSGTWRVTIVRAQVKRRQNNVALDYFVSVIVDGGPRLTPLQPLHPVDVGDPLPLLVGLHYPDRTVPANGEVIVNVTGPKASIRDLVAKHGLVAPPGGADPVNAWTATLQQIAATSGGVLPVPTFTKTVKLFDDGNHQDGAMEPDGVFGNVVHGLTKFEGTYDFHAVARYGGSCRATREAFWSLTVGLKDDPYRYIVRDQPGRPGKGSTRQMTRKRSAQTRQLARRRRRD
ncbi:MAG TPA: vWA domain-containing protein, partial [Vicinamibacterales bacterium]|nr:vWA domain-containing protein [Vicinamibacterales bacterium]